MAAVLSQSVVSGARCGIVAARARQAATSMPLARGNAAQPHWRKNIRSAGNYNRPMAALRRDGTNGAAMAPTQQRHPHRFV
jgi:hypothetical protein